MGTMEHPTPSTTVNGEYHHSGEASYHDASVLDYDRNMYPDLMSSRADRSLTLRDLDMGAIKKESYERTRAAMAAINPMLAKQVMPSPNKLSKEEAAAIIIQAHFRGYLARKQFVQLLYEQLVKEDEEQQAKIREQVEEGQLLVENYRLNVEMEENACLRRNQRRSVECDVITIQRAWRQYTRKGNTHVGETSINVYNMPDFNMPPQPLFSTPENGNFHIRTNPFMGTTESTSNCDDDSLSDVFNDSLEQVTEENLRNTEEHGPRRHIHGNGDVIEGDLSNDELSGVDPVSSPAELPSPTTDWESIESCLTSEGETQDLENNELLDSPNERLRSFSLRPKNLQICFVDDTLLSDVEGDEDGYVIKEYIIDKQDVTDDEKRDSGCVAGDEDLSESFSIKTVNPEMLENQDISHEDSEKVLLELHQQDSEGERAEVSDCSVIQGWTEDRLQELTVDELRALKRNMSQLIEAQNEVLVQELMNRDCLHLKQDSLLMDVEDASKLAQAQYHKAQRGGKR